MEKYRKYKVFSIIALMFAVVALSVGFAAFQKIMNISSSADVSLPSEDNLKLTLYGVISEDEYTKFLDGKKLDYLQGSKEVSYSGYNGVMNADYFATIDNENLTIDINDLVMSQQTETFQYAFLLRNESDYGVYVYLSEETKNKITSTNTWGVEWNATCHASDDATESLVNSACENIKLRLTRVKNNINYSDVYGASVLNNSFINGDYKLSPNSEMVFGFYVEYRKINDIIADGEFVVNFEPIKLEFGTKPASYYNITSTNEDA